MIDFRNFVFALFITAPFCVITYFFLREDFKKRALFCDIRCVSSFFDLKEIVHSENLRVYAVLYAFSLSFIFWILFGLLCLSSSIGVQIKMFLGKLIGAFSSLSSTQSLSEVAVNLDLPVPISLFLIICIVSVSFAPYLISASKCLKKIAHGGIGFDDTCQSLIRQSALDVEESCSSTKIDELFIKKVSLPREILASASPAPLEYALLFMIIQEVPQRGVLVSLRQLLQKNGIKSTLFVDPPPLLSVSGIAVFAAFYTFAATFFFGLVAQIWSLVLRNKKVSIALYWRS